ncbi:protein kinase family protein [Saccharomonospora marina XMU15]|uniref:non-specific serine/threonine protein kinase n=1 Tax=Saccharomonospora marina XMU15 TaxID=882083 RepID=H5XAH0_9PSEU|nr:serine/threonine-protein kinase [Saccharomonospora marina]EHR50400.1 protein kinase family protein [Saccharomonospora marina XMU15]
MTDEQTRPPHVNQGAPGHRTIANRYTLLGELGRGGMGVVWRAQDIVIGRQVAIKELTLPEGAEDAGVFQERVLREVRSGGRLNDPAVVTVFDVVAEGDTTFIVMELVEAPTLSEVVRRNGPLQPQHVASIGEQVLSALRAAHEAGIVHRDVKPGNIMVGPNGRVKLTDFGIAQAIDDPRLTTSGMLVGSPAFMAPERVAGRETLPASDLWSLGATLFFAVEGIVPFERSTTAATLHAIMNEVPYLTHARGPLASAIMGLLIATPEARINAEQARGLLNMAAAQQPLPPTPPGGQPTVPHQPGQPPTMLAGHTALGAGGPAPRGNRKALVIGGAVIGVAMLVAGFFLGKPVWSPSVDEALQSTLTYGEGGDIADPYIDGQSYYCVNTPIVKGRSIAQNNWVDCEEAHDAELYDYHWSLGGSDEEDSRQASYPGVEPLAEFGERACGLSFHSNRINDELRPRLRYQVLVPSQREWERRPESYTDDASRTVYCFAIDAGGGQLTGEATREIE